LQPARTLQSTKKRQKAPKSTTGSTLTFYPLKTAAAAAADASRRADTVALR
jgi:hypothetical protein